MHTVLAYKSALEFWRSPQSDAGLARARCRIGKLPERTSASLAADIVSSVGSGILSKPIHVLATDSRKGSSPDLVVHQMSSLPAGSLRATPSRNGATVLVTSPELTFVHMSSLLSFPLAAHLGFELCGTYAPDEFQPYGMRSRSPLTTPEKLESYLEKAGHVGGSRRARTVLPHVLSGSASPRESTLALLMTLSYLRGGSSIERPRMNVAIPLGRQSSWASDKSCFRCDLLWKDKSVAVEYDSTLCHTGATRIAEDAARRNALESLGLVVVTATWRQVENFREYNRFARILAGHLGGRIRPTCKDYPSKQFALRSELLR